MECEGNEAAQAAISLDAGETCTRPGVPCTKESPRPSEKKDAGPLGVIHVAAARIKLSARAEVPHQPKKARRAFSCAAPLATKR